MVAETRRTPPALWMVLALGLVTILSSCSLRSGLSGERPASSREWDNAQQDLALLTPPASGNPYSVTMAQFVIQTEGQPFYCGDSGIHAVILVRGCFRAEPENDRFGVIRYVPKEGNLRHEARHAILFALGDERWASVGH